MKKVLILLFAVMMSVSMSAEVLFSEDFSAGVGTLVESNNGWFTPYDGASGVSITNGLEFPGYVMLGVGNAVLLDGNCGQYQPHHTFAEVSQGSVYVAFMFQPSAVAKPIGSFVCAMRIAKAPSTMWRVFISRRTVCWACVSTRPPKPSSMRPCPSTDKTPIWWSSNIPS